MKKILAWQRNKHKTLKLLEDEKGDFRVVAKWYFLGYRIWQNSYTYTIQKNASKAFFKRGYDMFGANFQYRSNHFLDNWIRNKPLQYR